MGWLLGRVALYVLALAGVAVLPTSAPTFAYDEQSDDIEKRFDALALIDVFSIVAALPALRRLAAEFEDSTEPSAPYDWAKVNRIIGRLSGESVRADPE